MRVGTFTQAGVDNYRYSWNFSQSLNFFLLLMLSPVLL